MLLKQQDSTPFVFLLHGMVILRINSHKISDSWLNRVEEVVNYCLENNMYTIINIHWDGGWLENNCTLDKQERE